MAKSMNWEGLLRWCLKDGKDNVLKKLEAYHRVLENQQAYLFGDPETVNQASKMTAILLRQDETMIKLRQMTDEDIKRILEEKSHGGLRKKENDLSRSSNVCSEESKPT